MNKIETIAHNIIDNLDDRRGFDHWWDDIEPAIQREIIEDIATTIQDGLEA